MFDDQTSFTLLCCRPSWAKCSICWKKFTMSLLASDCLTSSRSSRTCRTNGRTMGTHLDTFGLLCRNVMVHCFRYQFNVLLLTFLSYSSYHLARKPTSVVKNVLHHKNCSEVEISLDVNITDDNLNTWCNWAPFGTLVLFQFNRFVASKTSLPQMVMMLTRCSDPSIPHFSLPTPSACTSRKSHISRANFLNFHHLNNS